MVRVRERTIPTERPPLVGEVIANFSGYRVPRGQRDGSLRPYSQFPRQEPLLLIIITLSAGIFKGPEIWPLTFWRRESIVDCGFERPPVVKSLDCFPAFYGTRRFITEFTRALRLFQYWARPIQSTQPPLISRRSILLQWSLYKAEPQGTENIFHIGQVSALYKIAKKKKMLNPLKSYYIHGAYLFISQNRRRWLL
jgi:hypothetical protein